MYEKLYILEHSGESAGHSVCQGSHVSLSWSLGGESFVYITINMASFALCSIEFVLMDENTILFYTASAFKREVEDCTLTCKNKYSLYEMGL